MSSAQETLLRMTPRRRARRGDCVKIDLNMTPEDGFVPEPLFDTQGIRTLILGWGDYLPGLHELMYDKAVGDKVENVSIDAGWGRRQQDLILTVEKIKLERFTNVQTLAVGDTIQLKPTMDVVVTEIHKDTVVVDANPPLAGTSYNCSFTVLQVDPMPSSFEYNMEEPLLPKSPYQVASFSLGCFWGAQLAFDRLPGVVGTRVGYTQGLVTKERPTYEQVCQGTTQHREAVLIVYDPKIVTYQELIHLAMQRLSLTTSELELHRLFEPNHKQYRHGCFFHTPQQREIALKELENNKYGIELLQATTFFEAEEEHQKYLYKGGQSARKEAKVDIRCYG